MEWFEQYKHPKWQKKRLEILERDGFMCTWCGDKEKQLHVHHRYYLSCKKIWEYPNESLTTLCEYCHKQTGTAKQYYHNIVDQTFESEVLSNNLDHDEISEALLLFYACGSPEKARIAKTVLFDLVCRVKKNGYIDNLIKDFDNMYRFGKEKKCQKDS